MKITLSVLFVFLAQATLAAEPDCAMFGFDAKRDSPHVEILDYKYGASGVDVHPKLTHLAG